MEMESFKEEILSMMMTFYQYNLTYYFRVFMNLAGITDIDEIATKAADIIGTVDKDDDGSISRKEWIRAMLASNLVFYKGCRTPLAGVWDF